MKTYYPTRCVLTIDGIPHDIASLTFDELAAESKPVAVDYVFRIRGLVEGVDVDLDKPLDPADD